MTRGGRRVRRATITATALGALVVVVVGYAYAATPHDLRNAGTQATINGAVFESLTRDHPAQAGTFEPFLEISSRLAVTEGYNTDFQPFQFDETTPPTRALLLSSVPQVLDGALWRVFHLDIREHGGTRSGKSYLNLDTVEIYESPFANLCGYPFDGSGGGHPGCALDNTATLVYDMDGLEDGFVWLDASNVRGAGRSDLVLRVPDTLFDQDPECDYGGVGCTVYVTLYSRFGGDEPPPNENDGSPEQWGVRIGD